MIWEASGGCPGLSRDKLNLPENSAVIADELKESRAFFDVMGDWY